MQSIERLRNENAEIYAYADLTYVTRKNNLFRLEDKSAHSF